MRKRKFVKMLISVLLIFLMINEKESKIGTVHAAEQNNSEYESDIYQDDSDSLSQTYIEEDTPSFTVGEEAEDITSLDMPVLENGSDDENNSETDNSTENLLEQEELVKEDAVSIRREDYMFMFDLGDDYRKEQYEEEKDKERYVYSICSNYSEEPLTVHLKSSDTNVIKITSGTDFLFEEGESEHIKISYQIVGAGIADIIATVGTETCRLRIYVIPYTISVTSIEQTAFQKVTLTWPQYGCSGYRIERTLTGEKDYQVLTTVYGSDKTSATLQAEGGISYTYKVIGFVEDEVRRIESKSFSRNEKQFIAHNTGAEISSVKKSGSSSLKIKWNSVKGASGYKLFRSTADNDIGKCIFTTDNARTTSFKQKVKKGIAYSYRLITLYPEGESDCSASVSRMIPKNSKVKTVSYHKIGLQPAFGYSTGQYVRYSPWALADSAYYYQAGDKLFMVSVPKKGGLKIHTLDSSLKIKKTRGINLKYDSFLGFYHGWDGNLYVAVAYKNMNDSKTKTVLKVIKYNSNWKKVKTANIKSTDSEYGLRIMNGGCRMDMRGTTLYLVASRGMNTRHPGHNANVSFKIDTKTMKAEEAGDCYVSHSFNQFVRFKDDSLYVLDHGDGYPRGFNLLIADKYGTIEQENTEHVIFDIKGEYGDNFTGSRLGGMEVGEKNVLVCGTSQPQGYTVKGVTGNNKNWEENAYLIVVDRKTGKSKFKWLTKYNTKFGKNKWQMWKDPYSPKSSSTLVGEARMVKLADDRFAVMYSTTKNQKSKLHYQVFDGDGNVVYSKTYSNMLFYGCTQPTLCNGSIVWTETQYHLSADNTDTVIYRIPAVF